MLRPAHGIIRAVLRAPLASSCSVLLALLATGAWRCLSCCWAATTWLQRAELLLGIISRRERRQPGAGPVNRDYLAGSLRYEDGKLLDAEGEGVMMGWETPLMERHAEIICGGGGAQV